MNPMMKQTIAAANRQAPIISPHHDPLSLLPESQLPPSLLPESQLPLSEPPESQLPESLPESQLPESLPLELPQSHPLPLSLSLLPLLQFQSLPDGHHPPPPPDAPPTRRLVNDPEQHDMTNKIMPMTNHGTARLMRLIDHLD